MTFFHKSLTLLLFGLCDSPIYGQTAASKHNIPKGQEELFLNQSKAVTSSDVFAVCSAWGYADGRY